MKKMKGEFGSFESFESHIDQHSAIFNSYFSQDDWTNDWASFDSPSAPSFSSFPSTSSAFSSTFPHPIQPLLSPSPSPHTNRPLPAIPNFTPAAQPPSLLPPSNLQPNAFMSPLEPSRAPSKPPKDKDPFSTLQIDMSSQLQDSKKNVQ